MLKMHYTRTDTNTHTIRVKVLLPAHLLNRLNHVYIHIFVSNHSTLCGGNLNKMLPTPPVPDLYRNLFNNHHLSYTFLQSCAVWKNISIKENPGKQANIRFHNQSSKETNNAYDPNCDRKSN
jgi:hypothetical protein